MKTKNRKVSSFEKKRRGDYERELKMLKDRTPEERLLMAIFGKESQSHYRF